MSRLIVVSNRVAPIGAGQAVGGMAVALQAALKESGGLWFGWSGEISKRRARKPKMAVAGSMTQATIDLTAADYEGYYQRFSNHTLWPVFHYRLDLSEFDRLAWEIYLGVNAQFAGHLMQLLRRDDLVWVHDYHLIPLARALRKQGCRAPIGFFLHIPFPAAEILAAIPTHHQLVRALFDYDVVGFQTAGDRRRFEDYVVHEAGGKIVRGGIAKAFDRSLRLGVFPVGIDADGFAGIAAAPAALRRVQRVDRSLNRRSMIIGVDRLDYTKGIAERLDAYARLLETFPQYRRRVVLMQVAPPSRSKVPGYRETRGVLATRTGHINGEYADVDWAPIRYLNRSYSQPALAGMYRAARIGLVTPLRDGMNLVAKEYVAAQDGEDPGVLVLSRFAGAASQLSAALIVNPHDIQGVAEALARGLDMPLAERQERWRAMMAELRKHDLDAWRNSFTSALGAARAARAAA
jgi:trehalose 6-phosphate synthase